ncbi:MAG: GTP-binding protein [Candidatus Woesearchaeota archaeon]|nr:MAG: GTP-binding protein [Candidatus Woesearchaeota archaeon]
MPDYLNKIKELEDLIAGSKYNKRTQHAIGMYKAQLAKLKEKEVTRGSKKAATTGYSVRKTGDGTVILVGFPSVGKSTLLNKLTDAESPVGAYAFTTLTVIPGVLDYKHAKIQILDVPGIVQGAALGKGRGKEVLNVVQNADLVIILLDALHPEHLPVLQKELYDSNIRLNKKKPFVKIRKRAKDGLRIGRTVLTPDLDDETIMTVLKEFRINNAEILIRDPIDVDDLIDVIEQNKSYVPSLIVMNKKDLVSEQKLAAISKQTNYDIAISADQDSDFVELKELIYDRLRLIPLFLKEPGKEADMKEPLIMFKDCTIRDVCSKLHKDFVSKFKFARVWGLSAKFPGQRLTLRHMLKAGDVLELHVK